MQPPSDSPDAFDLVDLCDLADVTPRTVRYYIQQGLLPSPVSRGPGAHYDRGHLDRLRVIRRLQREHLPLAEIRRRLESLDDGAVRALAESEDRPRDDSPLDYVRKILAGGAGGSPAPLSVPGAILRAPVPASAPQSELAELAPPGRHATTRATWERIELAPDIELHIRRPLTRAQNKLVDRLITQAHTLLSEES